MKFSAIFCLLNFLILFAIISSSNVTAQQESKNKFRERQATDDSAGYPNLDENELLNTQCPRNLELRWQAEVSSSIYAAPLIADINSDGKLDIVVPSFVHYLEVLEGSDGDKMPGWPAYHQSTVHASPLLYDIDKDGIREIALATYNGEVLFFRASGYLMSDKLIVPRRRVPKNWYEGLNPNPVDRSHPDVDDQQLIQEAAEMNLVSQPNKTKMGSNVSDISSTGGRPVMINESMPHRDGKNDNEGNSDVDVPKTINVSLDSGSSLDVLNTSSLNEGKLNESQETIKRLNTVNDSSENAGSNGTALLENGAISSLSPNELGDNMKTENRQNSRRRLLEDTAFKGADGGSENVQTATVENDDALEAEADSSFELFRGSDELADEYSYDYDDYVDDNMWGDEDWIESQHETVEDYVDIDSHILSTPVIADIDNDGILEMVVAVSYFFDRDLHSKRSQGNSEGELNKNGMKFSAIFCLLNFLILFAIISSSNVTAQQESKNKFRERQATDDSAGYPNLDENELLNTQCPRNLELRWQAEVSSSIYAAPLIADINSDGKLDIVVPSFVHYLEVLEGSDGDKMPGWPAYHQSTVHASPLLYDIDKDGIREIALATYNGEVLFFRASGYLMSDKLIVPRRRVPKNWYEGLNPNPVDRSHPDVDDQQLIQEAAEMNLVSQPNKTKMGSNVSDISSTGGRPVMINESMPHRDGKNDNEGNSDVDVPKTINVSLDSGSSLDVLNTSSLNEGKLNESQETIKRLNTVNDSSENAGSNGTALLENGAISSLSPNELGDNMKTENRQNSRRRLLEDTAFKGADGGSENVQTATVENDDALEAEADSSFELFRGSDELADEYSYDYDDYVDNMWGDEDWIESQHETVEDYVDIDSHILSTPVIADIDNDGILEMVVAVSYFFDRDYYDKPDNAKDLGGIDIGKYVAGGIVVFNLDTKQVKWTANLDLSTDSTKFRAYIYSSPTVVDLDNDGNLDILIGTSFGLFYVLDHEGKVRDNFPLEMAEIQGAVVAGDINDDGKIELVTSDVHGNVAAWNAQGKEVWETHVKSLIPQGPVIGDVDGDGHTDIVVPTISGNIYVLSGKDGKHVRPYPYRANGRIMNQALLVDMSKRGEKKKGLTIVTTSFDGYLYLIDGPTSCADVVDIGETSYSMVLADNVDGGDDLDLIVTTMNGNVFCFSTPSPHHVLKSWRSAYQGRNNVASRFNREGIYVLPSHRNFRDEEGKNFWVEFEIVDAYRHPSGTQAPYNVTVTLLVPGNFQGERSIKQNQMYDKPGKYRMKLPTVSVRTTGTVIIEMVDSHGLYFSDEFTLTFHMYYYKLLKWLVILPMFGMFVVLVILRPQEAVPLPSFSRNTDL